MKLIGDIRAHLLCLVLFLVVPVPRRAATAQTLISNTPSCPRCTFDVRVQARIGEADGPGSIPGRPEGMTIDRRGRYWFLFDREMPTVFDRNGRFVATVGRKGRGPGEFNSPTSVMAVPGDSVVIFDFGVPTSLIGPDLKFVRAIRTPPVAVFAAVPAEWPRTVWIHGESPIPQLAGWPLHVLQLDSASAEISKSVGLNDGELLAGKAYRLLHKLANSRTGDVWAVEMLDYRISRWTSHGALIEVLQRRPDWFPAELLSRGV